MEQNQNFDLWCIVELFGHEKVAGKCTEQEIAGTNFLRVDIPETNEHPTFTQFYGNKAIYSIQPVTEHVAKTIAQSLNKKPISSWDIREYVHRQNKLVGEHLKDSETEEDDLPFE